MNVLSFKQAETLMQGRLFAERMNVKHTHTQTLLQQANCLKACTHAVKARLDLKLYLSKPAASAAAASDCWAACH